MQYALIKTETATLGRVMNVILAEPDFIEAIEADWDHIEALDTLHEQGLGLGVGMGWGYDLATGEFIDPAPVAEPAHRPQIVVVGITADAAHAAQLVMSALREVTCPAGTTLQVVAHLQLGGQTLPVDDAFRVPFRSRDGRERVLMGTMVQGVITFNVPLPASGVWMVTEAAINEALPPEAQMAFAGLTLYVVEA